MATKNYRSFTGLKEFYYGVLDENTNAITEAAPERIEFLQNISIETPQEVVKANGDNKIAAMAVSTDSTSLTTTFHDIPIEDKAKIYGLVSVNGLHGMSAEPKPPYVACVFAKTAEGGGKEWIGFTKGIFTAPNTEGATKESGSIEFGSTETTGQFMSRDVEGVEEEITYLVGYDKAGETTNRDALFQAIFGKAHPDAGTTTSTTSA
ncbi:major tail protein [Salimicrobium album]|uniref:Phage major tail protein, phi13 family n=1 Tax=Salimicrobium album TaxID=50717 RepID=A0A1H3DFU2_9BACI|nr:major tail protein [Salimicrobium album]SDX65190.1 phage major tail protein, phi13 family [Salimicrobium album]